MIRWRWFWSAPVGRICWKWRRLRLTDPVLRQAGAFVCVRARYGEDRLLAGAFKQYVLLEQDWIRWPGADPISSGP